MHRATSSKRGAPRGQVLVIVAAGLVVLVAAVGVVIDGGYAWGRQRHTQNAADSSAKAGARVIQDMLRGIAVTDGDVGCAVEAAADANNVDLEEAVYTDWQGNDLGSPSTPVATCGSGGTIPPGAQGVRATGSQEVETFLARVIGFTSFTALADATAVVGIVEGICPASAGCPVLPVTFPRSLDTCDGQNRRIIGEDEWELLDPAVDTLDATNLAIMPLCSTGPGSVGWLDFGCGNLSSVITDPCNIYIPIPAWLHTQTGNVNALETELRAYTGDDVNGVGIPEEEDTVVFIPIHQNTCATDVDGPDNDPALYGDPPNPCPDGDWSGNGNNLYYDIPYWAGFKLDGAYTGGNDPECDQAPGSPPAGGNGATGCLKGWFVEIVPAPGPIGTGQINPGDTVTSGILLIE